MLPGFGWKYSTCPSVGLENIVEILHVAKIAVQVSIPMYECRGSDTGYRYFRQNEESG